MKDKKIITIIVLIILVFGLGGFIIYDKVLKEDDVIKEDDYKYTLNVYTNGEYLCLDSAYCSSIAFTIKTENSDAKVITFDNTNNLVLYVDNGYKIYNVKDEKSVKTSLVLDDYTSIMLINESYISITTNNKVELINVNNNKVELSENLSEMGGNNFDIYSYNNKNIFISYDMSSETKIINKIYDNDKKELFSSNSYFNIYKDNIYNLDINNDIKKYDLYGNLIDTIKIDGVIHDIFNNYIIYTNNDKLMVRNIDSNKDIEVSEYKELKNIYSKYYGGNYYNVYRSEVCYFEMPVISEGLVIVYNNIVYSVINDEVKIEDIELSSVCKDN